MYRTRVVLSIGSSDSSGGAGIQCDIKALAAVGCYAATALVGVTAQNTSGVVDRYTVPVDAVLAQFDAVLSDVHVDAVKVGMTWSVEHVEAVGARLSDLDVPVVVDPVMVSAAGATLAGSGVLRSVREWLFPVAAVVTPNLDEARLLADLPEGEPRELAERLVELGARAAVVTCGGVVGGDWYADRTDSVAVPRPGYDTGAEHGAGCAHSALITGLLTHRLTTLDAVADATEMAANGVREGLTTVGRGVHPIDLLGLGRTVRLPRHRVSGWIDGGPGANTCR